MDYLPHLSSYHKRQQYDLPNSKCHPITLMCTLNVAHCIYKGQTHRYVKLHGYISRESSISTKMYMFKSMHTPIRDGMTQAIHKIKFSFQINI